MSNKNKKTTSKYSNPDEAPIKYEDSVETADEIVEISKVVKADDSSVIVSETTETEEKAKDVSSTESKANEAESVKVTETKAETKNVKETSTPVPETVFTNFVRVRIVGIHKLAGYRMMSLVGIANIVCENTSGIYSVITSSNTARLVTKIIRENYNMLRMSNLSSERREQFIARFNNDLKRFKF